MKVSNIEREQEKPVPPEINTINGVLSSHKQASQYSTSTIIRQLSRYDLSLPWYYGDLNQMRQCVF
ncbi:hypothetical protein FD729_04315 [Pantoea sp. Nvir]|uniref:hypothetical protein n=1 Tax=Pantoea sp. Nvir TaxID=2576760 RepID=UPI00135AFFA4|nr:hypothetical protein [Pantoea sp. Nvir]MXP66973.1 hypothetical protein [Pantoea sp. Nvir]CAJ0992549.1 hypothetical protein NVIRPANT_00689 [Pantoea sp. Nvir]